MKINGTINIMGLNEVIFRRVLPDNEKYGLDPFIINRYVIQTYEKKPHLTNWLRIVDNRETEFTRSNDKMMATIKALALNPNAKLTFNDGVMYIDLVR